MFARGEESLGSPTSEGAANHLREVASFRGNSETRSYIWLADIFKYYFSITKVCYGSNWYCIPKALWLS